MSSICKIIPIQNTKSHNKYKFGILIRKLLYYKKHMVHIPRGDPSIENVIRQSIGSGWCRQSKMNQLPRYLWKVCAQKVVSWLSYPKLDTFIDKKILQLKLLSILTIFPMVKTQDTLKML